MTKAKKVKTKFFSRIPFILDPGNKDPKKIAKKFKKLINLFPALFLAKMGWDRPRKKEKNFSAEFCSYPTRARKFQKKITKKFKKLKNLIPVLVLSKTGWERPRKRENNFRPEFRSYSTRAWKFRKNSKKIQKINKPLSGIIFSQNGMR